MIDVTFFMEQHIGHYAYYENLRDSINRQPEICATWIPVTYTNDRSIWQRLPLLPAGVRGTLIGRGQVRQGLKKKGGCALLQYPGAGCDRWKYSPQAAFRACHGHYPAPVRRNGRLLRSPERRAGLLSVIISIARMSKPFRMRLTFCPGLPGLVNRW